eukprot:2363375-Pyramimonas_sp.AAC.1
MTPIGERYCSGGHLTGGVVASGEEGLDPRQLALAVRLVVLRQPRHLDTTTRATIGCQHPTCHLGAIVAAPLDVPVGLSMRPT